MFHMTWPGGEAWPQAAMPGSPFDWTGFHGMVNCPADLETLELFLGLEAVSGEVEFGAIELQALAPRPRPAARSPATAIDSGHGPGRLRGAMVEPKTLDPQGFATLTGEWGANLVRWQLNRPAKSPAGLAAWEDWLESELTRLDRALDWARETKALVVLDLHSPPGGGESLGGYQDASGSIWTDPAAQACFIKAWETMARRYKGDTRIWGFDLMNEPEDSGLLPPCLDWQKGLGWPGTYRGSTWNKEALRAFLQPVRDFADRYRVQIYVGEFSAIRWAPQAAAWLGDAIEIFEEEGWDWSYHAFREWQGWSLEHGGPAWEPVFGDFSDGRLQVLRQAWNKNRHPHP